jgi:hypothetical protein
VSGANQISGPVTFDYAWFQRRFPELSEWVSPDVAESYFDMATAMIDNRDAGGVQEVCQSLKLSPVTNIRTRQQLIGLLMAHLATLFSPINGVASPTTVGRITGASEGSVSVSTEYPSVPGAEWFNQTKYGALFWQLTARYHMMRYYVARQPNRWQFPPYNGTF